jgi:hypothetical protein
VSHPAPARGEVRESLLWLGVFGAPVLWSLQLLANYATIAEGCSPAPDGHAALSIGGVRAAAWIVTAIAAAGALAAGLVAWQAWQRSKDERASPNARAHESLLEIGEGRTRFMACFGLLSSGLFLIAVLFAALSLLLVSGCG